MARHKTVLYGPRGVMLRPSKRRYKDHRRTMLRWLKGEGAPYELTFDIYHRRRVVGSISVSPDNPTSATLSYGIKAPYRGKRYGPAALVTLSRWALGELGLTCLCAQVRVENTPSHKALERARFVLAKRRGDYCFYEKRAPAP